MSGRKVALRNVTQSSTDAAKWHPAYPYKIIERGKTQRETPRMNLFSVELGDSLRVTLCNFSCNRVFGHVPRVR